MEGDWITISEAARDRNVHWTSIQRAALRGELRMGRANVPGRGEMLVVSRSDVQQWTRGPQGRLQRRKEAGDDSSRGDAGVDGSAEGDSDAGSGEVAHLLGEGKRAGV